MYDPSFVLSTHVFILAILFRHEAFFSPGLNKNPDLLGTFRIFPGEDEFCLPLRPDIQGMFIFRKAVKTITGWAMEKTRIPISMMSAWISSLGVLSGFEHNTIAYSLRYMAGNNMDKNGRLLPHAFCISRWDIRLPTLSHWQPLSAETCGT